MPCALDFFVAFAFVGGIVVTVVAERLRSSKFGRARWRVCAAAPLRGCGLLGLRRCSSMRCDSSKSSRTTERR